MKKGIAFLLPFVLALGGCKYLSKGGPVVKKGSTVSINYTLTVEGKVVDSSVGREPLTYVQGSGQIIPGLEEQLEGLKAQDKKKVVVAPEKGYGLADPKAFQKVPRKSFGNSQNLKVGEVISGEAGGRQFRAVVAALGKDEVTLDMNHPLAGKTLDFDIEIVKVQ